MNDSVSIDDVKITKEMFSKLACCFSYWSFMIPTKEELLEYGYDIRNQENVENIRPVSKLQAFQYFITETATGRIYLLYEDGTEEVVENTTQLLEWDGYFGMECAC